MACLNCHISLKLTKRLSRTHLCSVVQAGRSKPFITFHTFSLQMLLCHWTGVKILQSCFLKRKNLFNWSWPRMCPSSLPGVCSSSMTGRPVVHLLPCRYTWLWFVALLKLCLFNSCKANAKGGQCPSTHLLVSGLSRPQSRFCLIQTEAKLWGKCMDNFDDRQQQSCTPHPHLPYTPHNKGKGPLDQS